MDSLSINLDRLRADILSLGKIGAGTESEGLTRPAFSEADMQARAWLLDRIEAAGGIPATDGAGNITGRWPGAEEAAAVLVGSHIDTVPAGGMLDGALGVLGGLECIRTLRDASIQPRRPVELIAFSDEEGRFGGMLGVQALCGTLTPDWIATAQDADGVGLTEAMSAVGLDPLCVLDAARRPEDLHAFIELHIEQGPVLEADNTQIGIVQGISGVFKWMVRLIGKANHAGTAPMNYRSDAFMGLADFAHEIPRIIDEDGSKTSRLTVGKAELKPGYPHTVPGEVEFSLVGRDLDPAVMRELSLSCRKVLSSLARRHNLLFEFTEHSWLDPALCHPELVDLFIQGARTLGLSYKTMESGAGHDTQFMTELTRAGMIFVPSVGGVSHAPDEWTRWPDIAAGTNLLCRTLRALVDDEPR